MAFFWAKFVFLGNDIFRLDTRIYLEDCLQPSDDDVCIGAIIGKNPGSAKLTKESDELQEIALDNDNLLPNVIIV